MPVPSSSLVFALVAAVPFGLAIRDTVNGTYDERARARAALQDDRFDGVEQSDSEAELREQALAEYRARYTELAELERNRRIEDERRAVAHESFDGLYGAELASIGDRFHNLVLGGPKGATTVAWPDHDTVLLDDGATTHTLYLKVSSDPRVCDALSDQLADAWGHTTGGQWVNSTIGQRARLDTTNGCALEFEKVVGVDDWLAKSTTAVVPMAAIGRPANELIRALGARATVSEDGRILWTAPGLAIGAGTTMLTAHTKGGRVVGLTATATIDNDTELWVLARISKLVGREPEEGEALVWKSSPPISVESGRQHLHQLVLRIGEQMGRN